MFVPVRFTRCIGQSLVGAPRLDTRWSGVNAAETPQARHGIGCDRAGRHSGPWQLHRGTIGAGNPHHAHRVPGIADPVGAGFVDSLARPGGNATGFMELEYSMSGKWLELLATLTAPGTGLESRGIHCG
jgi:hypothetical protein